MEKIGFLNKSLHCSMNYDCWLRIVQAGGNIAYTDEHLAHSRDYPKTKTRNLRGVVFKENLEISLRRLGYVHRSWISQYIGYFKYEKRVFWSKAISASRRMKGLIAPALQELSSLGVRDIGFTEKPFNRIV